MIVTPSSLVTGDYPVTYTFTLRTPYAVEPNAQIYVKFPTGDMYIYDTSMAGDKCYAINTLSQSNMRCSAKTSELTITKAFPSGRCACTGDISFSVAGIINPRSTLISGSFIVSILTSDNFLIYSKRTNINVIMTSPNTKTTASIT